MIWRYVRVRIMGSAGGDLRVSEPQIHRGRRPKRRMVYRVSEAREERAAHFDGDGVPVVAEDRDLGMLRPFNRARRLRRVWKAMKGADAHRCCSIDAT
jgi:hypothetical protein